MKRVALASVTGPGVDRPAPSAGVALSLAITLANRESDEATFYVRFGDEVVARVERDAFGALRIVPLAGYRAAEAVAS